MCAYMGTSDRLVSGLSLFHCGLWQLKNTSREENRSSDSYYSYEWARGLSYCNFPSSSSSSWKPIVPWERRISVAVSCCGWSDKTILLNMSKPPIKYTHTHTHTHMQKTYDGCTADNLFIHSHTILFTHFYWVHFWKLTWNLAQKKQECSESNWNACAETCSETLASF